MPSARRTAPSDLPFVPGDRKNFNFLFNELYLALCAFANTFVYNRQVAEDIVIEVFEKLWLDPSCYNDRIAIKTWLYIATKNACLNYIKKSKRFNNNTRQMPLDSIYEDPVMLEAIRAEVLAKISEVIDTLPKASRTIFRLAFLEGLSNNEIAQRLGLTLQTVKNQKTTAIKHLRKRMPRLNFILMLYVFKNIFD